MYLTEIEMITFCKKHSDALRKPHEKNQRAPFATPAVLKFLEELEQLPINDQKQLACWIINNQYARPWEKEIHENHK